MPDTNDVRWSKENNIIREGMLSILNPYDEFAIQSALDIKRDCYEGYITAITMGPPQAREVLECALARGCDDAILLSDKKFAGSDTLATSRTLAQCIKTKVPNYDLIICGQFAIDGDTAQTGPSIANHLGLSQITFIKEILKINEHGKKILVKQETEEGYNLVEADFPCILCINKGDKETLYTPRINDYIKASKVDIKTYSAQDIGLDDQYIGMKGSPTFVSRAFRPEILREPKIVDCNIDNGGDCGKTILHKIFERLGV